MLESDITFVEELNALQIRMRGEVSIPDLKALYDSALAHPNFASGVHLIWNGTHAKLTSLTLSDYERYASHTQGSIEKRGASRAAWVFGRPDDYRKACLFKARGLSLVPFQTEIFNDVHDAKRWIKASAAR